MDTIDIILAGFGLSILALLWTGFCAYQINELTKNHKETIFITISDTAKIIMYSAFGAAAIVFMLLSASGI